MANRSFEELFRSLTGFKPLSWQIRFYNQLVEGGIPPVCDLPTGLGKTAVIAIWLIARAQYPKTIPTRLVYVVDRRTVVDQATEIASDLRFLLASGKSKELQEYGQRKPTVNERKVEFADVLRDLRGQLGLTDGNLAVSTLRGQLADNREWSRDLSRPAIIIGTVDLIGSALLFSGYRSSYKRRPLEAGLLGQDSLLVLDEAHLSKPFEKLICALSDHGQFQKSRGTEMQGKPMRVIRMSATSGNSTDPEAPFTLQFDAKGNLSGEDAQDPIISERFDAKKRLMILSLGEKDDPSRRLAEAAIELAKDCDTIGKRIVVFVRRPEAAVGIADLIRKHGSTRTKPGPYAEFVEVLTGTMRGLERDELAAKRVFTDRWLNGRLDPSDPANQEPAFLVSTSAGEVGFDLNADHLVGDDAPLDSWIQRLGRVNRRGKGIALVQVFVAQPREKKHKEADADKHTFASASIEAMEVLRQLPEAEPLDSDKREGPIFDASPRALCNLAKPATALTPAPTMVELTDILLDAWSMTSISEPMPGRPEVAPWLRGIADDLPQTTIAWRAELELLAGDPAAKAKFKAIFAAHRIRPHESLTTNSGRVVEFLQQITRDKGGQPELKERRVVVKLSRDLKVTTIGDLIDDPHIFFSAEPTLILPATFGGLDKGLLSPDAISPAPSTDAPAPSSLDVADMDGYESREGAAARWRIVLERDGTRWKPEPLSFSREQATPIAELLGLEHESHRRADIANALRTRLRLRTRDIIPLDIDEEGEPRRLLLLLSGVGPRGKRESQALDDHVGDVEREASRIADALRLAKDGPVRQALVFAAKWHDEGKRSPVWQRFIRGSLEKPLGKSAQYCDPRRLAGYRHEFGSVLRVRHPDAALSRGRPELPSDESVRDLALHLIAVHHGHGRPHFRTPIDRDFHMPALIDEIHTESIRRFAHLQRKYGWWHLAWLENLLRCADAIASEEVHDDDNQEDDMEGGEL